MTRSSKDKQQRSGKRKSSNERRPTRDNVRQQQRIEQFRGILEYANEKENPLESMPFSLLSVSLSSASPYPGCNSGKNDPPPAERKENGVAIVRHFSSPLPPKIFQQCLDMFRNNMGDMYTTSKWGLDMEQKSNEMQHPDARFLITLSSSLDEESVDVAADANDAMARVKCVDAESVDFTRLPENDVKETIDDLDHGCMVLGFAHFRYEYDDSDRPKHPVTYLYELQVHPNAQKFGMGKKLLTIVELISLDMKMEKVMLTVFRANVVAMEFYARRKYIVDESSPSNFTGEENENCEYEILSKMLTSPH